MDGSSCENNAMSRVEGLHGVALFAVAVLDAISLVDDDVLPLNVGDRRRSTAN